MAEKVHGIHHVTCIAGDPQRNIDFYVTVMGLRLVKRSVNQDSPDTYHFFFADAVGTPGTDLTFFPWPGMQPLKDGHGITSEVVFAIPSGSGQWWEKRLRDSGVVVSGADERFGERAIRLRDPDGLHLALVETQRERHFVPWGRSSVPAEHQLRGMDAVRLTVRDIGPSASFAVTELGFSHVADDAGWQRYSVDPDVAGTMLEFRAAPEMQRGRWGTGGVHHVAWRVTDVDQEMEIRSRVEAAGRRPTPLIDRFWFSSVYFLEPGGVLFELATDGPGFGRDESSEQLGEKLILPPWLESERERIEAALPAIEVP